MGAAFSRADPETLCTKPRYLPNFAACKDVGAGATPATIEVRLLDPFSGKRWVMRAPSGTTYKEVVDAASKKTGRQVKDLELKIGRPEQGDFVSTHPGWDQRTRVLSRRLDDEINAQYMAAEVYCLDIVVDAKLVEAYAAYCYY